MTRYWASYGRSGFLGHFTASEEYSRGMSVVVQSPRGVEVATILELADDRFADGIEPGGTILRVNTQGERDARGWLSEASEAAASLPVLVADAEWLLDDTLILHVMPWDEVDLTPWATELAARFGFAVQVLNLADLPREKLEAKGCGKPGCGEAGGGGCSTGGCGTCSRGSVKSSDELTEYFAGLRTALESKRVTLA